MSFFVITIQAYGKIYTHFGKYEIIWEYLGFLSQLYNFIFVYMRERFCHIVVCFKEKNADLLSLIFQSNCTDYKPASLFLPSAISGWMTFIMPASNVYMVLSFKQNNDLKVIDLVSVFVSVIKVPKIVSSPILKMCKEFCFLNYLLNRLL